MSSPSQSSQSTVQRRLIITVHGIRTFGQWQERLESLVRRANRSVGADLTVLNYKFGYFSALAYLSVFLRWITVRRFRQELLAVTSGQSWDRIDIVAHSFGTFLAAKALYSLRDAVSSPRIHTVILAGSVLPARFPWSQLVPRIVNRVINDCGTKDQVLLLSQMVPFLGMAGRTGFHGMTGLALRNRFFSIGHSGYFLTSGSPCDSFMLDHWVPLLTEVTAVEAHDCRPPDWSLGLEAFLLNNARPGKIVSYTGLVTAALFIGVPFFQTLDAQRTISGERGYAVSEPKGMKVWFDSGAIPSSSILKLSAIRSIHELDLAATGIGDRDVQALATSKTLSILKLGDTKVTAASLYSLERFPNLTELTLYNTRLREMNEFPNLPLLRVLDLQGTGINDHHLRTLGKLKLVSDLDLQNNQIKGEGLADLTPLRGLKRLDLTDTPVTDAGLQHLPVFPELAELVLQRCANLRGAGFAGVARLSSLRELWLSRTPIGPPALVEIGKLAHLQILSLPETDIGSGSLGPLRELRELRVLYLGGTGITDRDLETFLDLSQLSVLYVPGNAEITDEGLLRLQSLRSLREVNIDDTAVTSAGRALFQAVRPDVKFGHLE